MHRGPERVGDVPWVPPVERPDLYTVSPSTARATPSSLLPPMLISRSSFLYDTPQLQSHQLEMSMASFAVAQSMK